MNLIYLSSSFFTCMIFAAPGAAIDRGLIYFVWTLFLSTIRFILGVLVPVYYFFLSAVLEPEWRGVVTSEFDCLISSKVYLTPLAFWAWLSFYLVEVVRVRKIRPWHVLGLFTGSIGSIGSVATLANHKLGGFSNLNLGIIIVLLPLIYVPLLYCWATYKNYKKAPVRPFLFSFAAVVQSSFWLFAARKSLEWCAALPENPPHDCYVVTASTYGYPWLVRSQIKNDVDGNLYFETKQLVRFRQFEKVWCENLPLSHKYFRKVYNWIGPKLARKIRHPVLASVSYLVLKPFEYLVVGILALRSRLVGQLFKFS